MLHPYVQKMVAGTNGRAYIDVINRLQRYPIPALPAPEGHGGLLLDIGCGWGRWMVAAVERGYQPIGLDIKFDGALATTQVMKDFGLPGYTVVGDLQALPFVTGAFDFVWSFSVIQHVHRDRARSCVRDVARVLRPGGDCKLEFPLRSGFWNRRQARRTAADEDKDESWCVRYYTLAQLEELFDEAFGNFAYDAHCYFGIGYQPVDLQFVPWRFMPVIATSLALTALSGAVPPLKRMADSVYVSARKTASGPEAGQQDRPATSLKRDDFYALLRCPVSGESLTFDPVRQELVARRARYAYVVREGIPILLRDQKRSF
jgi:SAM-dependent methyltransferase/uncharacterized protein YbaR (Trm112 family)